MLYLQHAFYEIACTELSQFCFQSHSKNGDIHSVLFADLMMTYIGISFFLYLSFIHSTNIYFTPAKYKALSDQIISLSQVFSLEFQILLPNYSVICIYLCDKAWTFCQANSNYTVLELGSLII